MKKVLVLEDESSIRSFIVINLRRAGYEVVEAESGEEALEKLSLHSDVRVALLDIMLPGIDGTELLGRMRASTSLRRIPVIMATAKGAEYDRVRALDGGADDYLTKPFSVIELVSRVKAVLRRCQPEGDSSILRSGEVSLDTRAHTVLSGGERVDLTYKEYELLRLFLSHPGTAYTRDRLMEEYDAQYPQYGFAVHKGYGTKRHYEALREFGPSPIHRKTFLKKFYENP